jgi:hypothetical protein
MASRTLGDFHINLLLPLSHIQQSQFQQGIAQEIIQQFGPTQIVLFEPPGEIDMPKQRVLAIKQSIKELWHLTYFTDVIIVHGVQCSQFVICKGIGSKQHMPLMQPFQGNHVRTYECLQHGLNVAGPGWDGTSTGGQSRDLE